MERDIYFPEYFKISGSWAVKLICGLIYALPTWFSREIRLFSRSAVIRLLRLTSILPVYSSGQRGLTVNQLPFGYGGSNPSAGTTKKLPINR